MTGNVSNGAVYDNSTLLDNSRKYRWRPFRLFAATKHASAILGLLRLNLFSQGSIGLCEQIKDTHIFGMLFTPQKLWSIMASK